MSSLGSLRGQRSIFKGILMKKCRLSWRARQVELISEPKDISGHNYAFQLLIFEPQKNHLKYCIKLDSVASVSSNMDYCFQVLLKNSMVLQFKTDTIERQAQWMALIKVGLGKGSRFHVQVSSSNRLEHALLHSISVATTSTSTVSAQQRPLNKVLTITSPISDLSLHAWDLNRVRKFSQLDIGIRLELCPQCLRGYSHHSKSITFIMDNMFIRDCLNFLCKEAKMATQDAKMDENGFLVYTLPHQCSYAMGIPPPPPTTEGTSDTPPVLPLAPPPYNESTPPIVPPKSLASHQYDELSEDIMEGLVHSSRPPAPPPKMAKKIPPLLQFLDGDWDDDSSGSGPAANSESYSNAQNIGSHSGSDIRNSEFNSSLAVARTTPTSSGPAGVAQTTSPANIPPRTIPRPDHHMPTTASSHTYMNIQQHSTVGSVISDGSSDLSPSYKVSSRIIINDDGDIQYVGNISKNSSGDEVDNDYDDDNSDDDDDTVPADRNGGLHLKKKPLPPPPKGILGSKVNSKSPAKINTRRVLLNDITGTSTPDIATLEQSLPTFTCPPLYCNDADDRSFYSILEADGEWRAYAPTRAMSFKATPSSNITSSLKGYLDIAFPLDKSKSLSDSNLSVSSRSVSRSHERRKRASHYFSKTRRKNSASCSDSEDDTYVIVTPHSTRFPSLFNVPSATTDHTPQPLPEGVEDSCGSGRSQLMFCWEDIDDDYQHMTAVNRRDMKLPTSESDSRGPAANREVDDDDEKMKDLRQADVEEMAGTFEELKLADGRRQEDIVPTAEPCLSLRDAGTVVRKDWLTSRGEVKERKFSGDTPLCHLATGNGAVKITEVALLEHQQRTTFMSSRLHTTINSDKHQHHHHDLSTFTTSNKHKLSSAKSLSNISDSSSPRPDFNYPSRLPERYKKSQDMPSGAPSTATEITATDSNVNKSPKGEKRLKKPTIIPRKKTSLQQQESRTRSRSTLKRSHTTVGTQCSVSQVDTSDTDYVQSSIPVPVKPIPAPRNTREKTSAVASMVTMGLGMSSPEKRNLGHKLT